ncbi:NAD(P)H-binding protein [Demetria terragena]|uniref:NAD(P)H-binding protein n=1 Tax=Demetria terragena TaxID=63959 RepID=UPI000368DB64|nr:NAD(P)H-binding protein [Demetria terragena]
MIVVTGATGALNGVTVEHLLRRLPANEVGVSVRDATRAQHLADQGVRVRTGSYDDPDALRASFEGATQVLLVSSNDMDANVADQHRRAIDAAVAAGAQRILFTSQHGAGFDSPYPGSALAADAEAHLATSGVAWTALRNGFFGDLSQLLGPWQKTGVIAKPADGPFSWTSRVDAGEAAAAILTSEDAFEGPIDLTAPIAVTLADFAAIGSELTGRTIERVVLGDEEWVASEIAAGIPEAAARFSLAMFQASRSGHFAAMSPALSELLGRAPRSAAELMAEQAGGAPGPHGLVRSEDRPPPSREDHAQISRP